MLDNILLVLAGIVALGLILLGSRMLAPRKPRPDGRDKNRWPDWSDRPPFNPPLE
jgi:hypothetical protein